MAVAITRSDLSAEELRGASRRTKDGYQARDHLHGKFARRGHQGFQDLILTVANGTLGQFGRAIPVALDQRSNQIVVVMDKLVLSVLEREAEMNDAFVLLDQIGNHGG